MDEAILVKLNIVVVFDQRMCMKEDNLAQNFFYKGDKYMCRLLVSFLIWLTVLVRFVCTSVILLAVPKALSNDVLNQIKNNAYGHSNILSCPDYKRVLTYVEAYL